MKRVSLYTIIFVIFLFLIIVSFLFISFATIQHRQDLIKTTIKERTHLAETIKETMTSPVWIYRFALVPGMEKSFIDEMAKFEDVRYIRIVNADGTIYKSSIEGEWGKIIKDPDISKVVTSRKKIVKEQTFQNEKVKLIIYPGYQDKTIWIAFTLRGIEKSIEKMWVRDVLTNLSVLLLFLCFLLIILRSTINPLKEITLACEKIRKGNLDVRIDLKSKTEIGELAETFNRTVSELKASYASLKKARLKAEAEKNKTLAIITNFADGLLVFNKKRQLALVNPKAEYFLDIKSEKVTGLPISKLSEFPTLKLLVDILGKEIKEIFRKELKVRENLILEVSTIPIIREEEMIGTLVILHDITREKRIERLKTEFVSLSAHQLRTPLSAIKWALKMLLDGDAGRITKEQKNLIEKTYQSNERMIKLINDLLSVTRIEEGRYLFRLSPVHLEDIVQFVINSYKDEIKKKKIKLIFKKPKQRLPETKLDVEKIRLVIQNLLDNALRYTPKNGTITICLKKNKNLLKFSIKDTGIGIPKAQQKRVFSKFFRARNAIKVATEGSGLGLFVCKNIIESHKGKIWFKSEEGKGTTFYFTLPRS